MAQFQHAAAKQRARRRYQTRSPSPSRHHDWNTQHHPPPHSLPYRSREPEITLGLSGTTKPKYYSQRAATPSDDSDLSDPMPHPQHQLARPAPAARNGKGRAVYLEIDDDDDEDERMISRLRSRSRPRTRSKARSTSSSGDDETYELSTPPRSTPQYRSRPTSRLPSVSSSRSSSVDSDSSVSTLDERTKRRARKRPSDVPLIPPAPGRAEHRRHRPRHRDRSQYREEDTDAEPEYDTRLRLRERSKSVPRPRRQIQSRSTSRVRQRPRDRYEEGEPSTSKRPHRRRYYDSDTGYEKPALPRAHTAPSSHITAQRLPSPPERSSKMVECVVCLDDLPSTKTAKLKCGHRMCKSCLKRSFKLSVKDPAQMPPRCCTSDCIPLKHVDNLFDVNFKKTWNQKFHEFSTRNRVYCPGKRCGRWIRPDQIQRHHNGRKVGKCGGCQTRVCCDCNNRWHGSDPCPADEETNQILQQAKEEGWQRCFNCRNMVELKEGCNHMTCRCGAEFCMICGLKWKTCECPWFNYDNIDGDHLDHMQIPEPMIDRDRLGPRSAPATPRLDPRRGVSPGHTLRPRPTNYDEDLLARRFQERHDEEFARRLQYEDTEDDYMDPLADGGVGGVDLDPVRPFGGGGLAPGHDEYRRRGRAQTVIAPPAPAPPPPTAPFERTTNSVADYVTGVNRARGLRASSMERRLADRFETRPTPSPAPTAQNPFGGHAVPAPPPPAAPRAMGPPAPALPLQQQPLSPPPQMGMGMGMGMPMGTPLMMRRHTVDDDQLYEHAPQRIPPRMLPRRAGTTRSYIEDPHHAAYEAGGGGPRVRRRGRAASTSPKDSVLAGLTGPGRGMHRVYEWVNHVEQEPGVTA